jgi:hypothetical protein
MFWIALVSNGRDRRIPNVFQKDVLNGSEDDLAVVTDFWISNTR